VEFRSLYGSGSLKTVSTESAKYKSDSVAVQKVRWNKDGTELAAYILFGNGNADHHLGTGFFIHKGIISPVKRVEFVSNMS
jgi:hypothetical protein